MQTDIFVYDDKNYDDKNSSVAQKSQLAERFSFRYQIMYSFLIAGYISLKQQTNAVNTEMDLFQLYREWIWRVYFNVEPVDIIVVRTALLNWIFWTSQSVIILWIFQHAKFFKSLQSSSRIFTKYEILSFWRGFSLWCKPESTEKEIWK